MRGIEGVPRSQLPQQTPFTFELSNNGYTSKGNENQTGDSEKATSGQKLKLTRSVFA
jgi:hypothetical protein